MNKPLMYVNLVTILLGVFFCAAPIGRAGEAQVNMVKTERNSIHIVSDQLTVDTQNMSAEFNGQVRAVQADMIMESDQLTVFYDKEITNADQEGTDEQSIRKIIAKGSVRIQFDNRVAVADEAVYTAVDQILILTGKEVKISSEKDSIRGEKIIINRADGKMTVIRSQFKQVEATFTAGENGIK